jgi:hypothetical protein
VELRAVPRCGDAVQPGERVDDVVSSLIGIFLASGSPEQTGRMLDLLVAGTAAAPT